jgi:hypothetical protein
LKSPGRHCVIGAKNRNLCFTDLRVTKAEDHVAVARHGTIHAELAVEVFESLFDQKDDLAPVPGATGADAVSGRGLQVAAGMSAGRWGSPPDPFPVRWLAGTGKAVWFALPVPGSVVPGALQRTRLAPGRAAWALEEMLVARELGAGLLRAREPGGLSPV